jgi:tRNA pseudouridine55 synthase
MNGIIVIDKPAGASSAEVVRLVKARVKPARVGHLGTLDPFATGVLPILVGEATKLAPFLHEGEKHYTGAIALGAETDTLDPTGEITRIAPVPSILPAALDEIAKQFHGEIEQTPPVYSAIKRAGVPLYKLARRGGEVAPPPPRKVTLSRLTLAIAAPDRLQFDLVCSPGTYVRALARDIGAALGTAAHLAELRRLGSGRFSLAMARPLADALADLEQGRDAGAIGMRAALDDFPEARVDAALEKRLRHGDSRALDGLAPPHARHFKVVADGRLIAIAETTSRVTAVIVRVFAEQ